MADNMQQPTSVAAELGATGLKRFGGYIYEEFLPELKGIRAIRAYREMGDNDSTVRAMLFAVEMLIRNITWDIEPYSTDPDDQMLSDFVKSCLDDMEQPWAETLAEILSFLRYGWSYHEVVYKYRRGYSTDLTQNSKHNDGLLGWRKMPIRSQDSLLRWEFDDVGDLIAMEQIAPPTYKLIKLPVTKCLLFRATTHKGNPQGDSILRGAYRSWYMKKHIENIEAIGVERDLAGLPIFWLPPHLLSDDASDDDKAVVEKYKKMVTNLKRDEQEGMLMPLAFDENNNKLYDFTLLSSGSRRQFDTNGIIRRYDQNMAMTILADWILIGHEKVGSFALNSSKQSMFATAIGAWCGMIADVMNRVEIPRLLRINGFMADRAPKMVHEEVDNVNLEQLAALITALQGAGAPLFPDDQLESHIRRIAGLPIKVSPDQMRSPGSIAAKPPSTGQEPLLEPPAAVANPGMRAHGDTADPGSMDHGQGGDPGMLDRRPPGVPVGGRDV